MKSLILKLKLQCRGEGEGVYNNKWRLPWVGDKLSISCWDTIYSGDNFTEHTRAAPVDTVRANMEGCYKVVENINFENFLRVMGVTEDDKIQAMIAATKQVSLIFDELFIHCLIRWRWPITETEPGLKSLVSKPQHFLSTRNTRFYSIINWEISLLLG